ncbi:type II secretion system protein GspK [Pseudoteredinibacter isoporae]|uniref:General secretion pathway protein K n=1 Tax=Pseudoteredinibacter isoporae TaxID=570281 RepID=A0A7X0MX06_9GAMM|nr:type II secretion system protein GspK [Pseudoteredinibacter isoporae]MBB6521554.1 general secretion pathway protein K [Pseudoteredinibacter isoporae]NHO87108.1 hypothetical protein [Pseudoteredinibacter isoporae]NIB22932.1 hypothetical protein [Pseudoteredinibacter isoporae]
MSFYLARKPDKVQQSGVALILVLFLVAIVSLLAVNAGEKTYQLQHRLTMQKQQQAISNEQIALEAFALSQYSVQIRNSNISSSKQAWQQPLTLPFEESHLRVQLMQQPACFNLSSLIGMNVEQLQYSTTLQQLLSLLENLNSPGPLGDLENILKANETLPGSINDINPIEAKQALEESLRVQWSDKDWQKFAPFICYLPSRYSRWNINGFDKTHVPLLKALLLNQLQDSGIEELIDIAQAKGFDSNHSFWQQESLKAMAIPAQLKLQLRVKSEYYWLNTQIRRSHSRLEQWYFLQQQGLTLKRLHRYRT